jgi:hypothetical protein
MRINTTLLALMFLLAAGSVFAIDCSNPDYILCDDFEASGTHPSGLPDFRVYASYGVRHNNAGRDSPGAFSNVIMDNSAIPPYPEVPFSSQSRTIFVKYDVKVPENFFTGRGGHGYYVRNPSLPGSVTIDPQPEGGALSDFEWDEYTRTILRGSGYQRLSTPFEGAVPKNRGEWHSYQLMIVPSNRDSTAGRLKLWIDGELVLFTKTDTIPQYNQFWISNYWHSLIYVPQDNPCCDNLHEDYTAPLHPTFELFLDNLVVSPEFIEDSDNVFQIERIKYNSFSSGAFRINFDTTLSARAKIEWGESPSYGNQVENTSYDYFHSLGLSELQANRTYYLRITATDAQSRNAYYTTNFTTASDNIVPIFDFQDWKGEV